MSDVPESVLPESVLPEATGPDATLVVVTRNVISDAIGAIAEVIGMPLVVLDEAVRPVSEQLNHLGLTDRHAVVLTDHDAPDAAALVRQVLAGPAGYLGMMGSRSRSTKVFETLRADGVSEVALGRLHVPVGLDLGGSRTAGLIALSVLSEVTAWANGKLVREGDRGGLAHPAPRAS